MGRYLLMKIFKNRMVLGEKSLEILNFHNFFTCF